MAIYMISIYDMSMAELVEEIRAASPLQELAAMRRRSDELDRQIAEAEEAYGIRLLREQKALVDADFSARLAEVAPTLSYGEDKFLKALKKKGESHREGGLRIIRTSRTARVVRVGEFVRAFPGLIRARLENQNMTDEAAMRLLLESGSKIELTKIDALVGKATVKSYCDEKVSYSYEFLSMPENTRGEA
jgi:hypothetical protein